MLDWLMKKINGRKTEKRVVLENNSLPKKERKLELKFYKNNRGRYSVHYNGKYLCMCDEQDISQIQDHFDKEYNGKNFKKVSKELKEQYNHQIQSGKSKKKRGRSRSYRFNEVNFQEKDNGRMCVRVSDNGKQHTICQCYPSEQDAVSTMYDSLKKTHDIEDIKKLMKDKYNLHTKTVSKSQKKETITLDNNGVVYKNGKMVCVDNGIFEKVNKFID